MNPTVESWPVGLSQRWTSSGFSENTPASAYDSESFQWLTKLSWQLAHFRFVPRNTCATFWAAWTGGAWLAFTTPRQTMPFVNPSEPGTGLTRSWTNRSYGVFSYRA